MSYKFSLEFFGSARLMQDGSAVKIYTGETKGGLGTIFLFLDKHNDIINTLSVENYNLSGPTYEIIKGVNRDWLAVTTIPESGTGYIKYKDTWYMTTGYFGETQKVLSYDSKVMEDNTNTNKEVVANVITGNTDDILDIKYTTKLCVEKDVCNTTSKINHYVWKVDKEDEGKSSFILNKTE